ncbi:MAG: GNAT family N-acetyltransferase [Anaerolineales bacterium]|nr:GNAT family N-acetyltransferase [Anaerolineales bacterium]
MPKQTLVRAARAEDKDAIVAFCQNTFSWGDYIADVWERWLADPKGQLLVGVVDDQPVSLMHVALHGALAWLEGMRVHPDFRRQGIARLVEAEGRAWAHARGCRVACLATSIKNVAAQAMLDAIGYRRAAQFNEWEIEPAPDDFSFARIAAENDWARASALWDASESCAASHSIIPNRHWHWTPLDETRWREHLRAGEVRFAPNGLALLLASEERDWIGMLLIALAGDEETMYALARAARGEAAYRGYPRLEGQLADCPTANRALERAGFQRGGGMFIYEIELR